MACSFLINNKDVVCLLSYTLRLTPTPSGIDYSGLSTWHTRIAWAYLEIANIYIVKSWVFSPFNKTITSIESVNILKVSAIFLILLGFFMLTELELPHSFGFQHSFYDHLKHKLFGMAAMPFLCSGFF